MVRSGAHGPPVPPSFMSLLRAVLPIHCDPNHQVNWSYLSTGPLPRLISCICHSYENTGGVGVFFPFWEYPHSTFSRQSPVMSHHSLNPSLATHPKNSTVTSFLATLPKSLDLKSFACHTSDTPTGDGHKLLTRFPVRKSVLRSTATKNLTASFRHTFNCPLSTLRSSTGHGSRSTSHQQ